MGRRLSLSTRLVHGGEHWTERSYDPTVSPIYPSTTYRTASPEEMDAILGGEAPGFTYARHGSPTVAAFAASVAEMEEAETALALASGMAAVDAAIFACQVGPGDVLLLSRDLYGASLNQAQKLWGASGVKVVTVDLIDLEEAEAAIRTHRPKAVLFEILSNPLLKVADGPALVTLAKAHGARTIVDNTFTPLVSRPLTYGADLCVHSVTKYIGGHGDATGGVVAGPESVHDRLHQYLKLRGAVPSPFDTWLLHRGLKTLPLRYRRQCESATALASQLAASGCFARVVHPTLEDHPSRDRARRLFGEGWGGAIVTLELPGGKPEVFAFLKALRVVGSATTVGDIYTQCLYPMISSHRNQSDEERAAMGITPGTVRISVGIEDPDDLAEDIIQAARHVGSIHAQGGTP